jgi:hypothetical protein
MNSDTGQPESAPPTSSSQWQYATSEDPMRHAQQRTASLESTDELHFSFPYSDARGRLILRQSPQFGFDIMLAIDSGQFVCHSFTGGRVAIKFDDGPVRDYTCNEAADGDTTTIFLGSEQELLSQLRRSRTMMLETEYFQAGRQQLTFNVAGLQWPGAPARGRR